jgi:5,10-methylenetetrahydromethanopterin reductase
MTRQLSLAFQSDKRPEEYEQLALLAESYGFDALTVYGDLLFQPPIVALTLMARATSRIRLGPASLNPWTLHPVEIAGQIAALDQVSDGRAYLGLSRGAWLDELGIEQRAPLSRMRETLDVVGQLLRGEQATYDGRHVRLAAHHALRYDRQRSAVPLLIGSWGPKLLALGGERAQEVKIGGSTNPDLVSTVRGWVAQGATSVGRDPDEIGVVFGAVTIVDEDGDAARRAIRREMAVYLPVVAGLDPTLAADPQLLDRIQQLVNRAESDAAGALIPADLLSRFAFAGSPDDVIGQCEALFAAGVTRIEFGTPHGMASVAGVRLLGERVLPALREWRT